MKIIILLYIFSLGATLGSFSLVLTKRLKDGRDWLKGRSECDKCKTKLKMVDLIPVISWLSLKGHCRYCKKPIGSSAIVVEVLLGLTAVLSYWFWPHAFVGLMPYVHFAVWLIVLTICMSLFLYDLKWMQLPVYLMKVLICWGFLEAILELLVKHSSIIEGILAMIASAILVGGLFWLLHRVSRGKWIGDGDASLGFGLGLLVGSPAGGFMMIFLASVLGSIIGVPLVLFGKKKFSGKLPFGPLLITAAVIVQIFGARIVDYYLKLIGLS